MEMKFGKNTDCEIFINNVSDRTDTLSGNFIVDSASYPAMIAVSRGSAGNTDYNNRWSGFILDFHIYQNFHDVSNTNHATCTVCQANPVAEFNEFLNESGPSNDTCDAGTCADRSCVKSGTC
jgi:hypothetical protein